MARILPSADKALLTPLALALALAMSGCPSEPSSTNNGDDGGAVTVDAGDAGDAEVDTGPPSCATSDDCTGDWAGAECVGGVCTDCDAGDLDCACRLNGTCGEGLRCDDDSATCVTCAPGQEDCACDEGECEDGFLCDSDVCVLDTCTDGALECPCGADGACDDTPDAYCDDMTVCRACTSDIVGCACEDDGTCAGTNYCDDQDLCQTCPDADKPVGCACDEAIDCATGLACDEDSGECRERLDCDAACVPNQACDESSAGDAVCIVETCNTGYEWDPDTSTCIVEIRLTCDGRDGSTDLSITCAMQSQACVEVGGEAVCVTTCAAIQTQCDAENRSCNPAALGNDASCGACAIGYIDDGGGACVVDTALNCSTFGAIDSIAQDCADQNQECDEIAGGGAQCGACLQGFTLDPSTGSCVAKSLCGGVFCADGEYCDYPQTSAPPSCQPKTCADGEYLDGGGACTVCALTCDAQGVHPVEVGGACACASDVFCSYGYDGAGDRCTTPACPAGQAVTPGGQCITCNIQCGQIEGQLSRIWPETTADGTCLCETQQGYYADPGGNLEPKQCDQDEDGWINRSSALVYESALNVNIGGITRNEAVLANFRCGINEVDTFVLKNEWGQSRHVSLCGDEMIDYVPGQPSGCQLPDTLAVLKLIEPDVLDDDDKIRDTTNDRQTPYGARDLAAKELNGLTKMCVTIQGDYNANGVADVLEEHAIVRDRLAQSTGVIFNDPITADEDFAYHSVSYFGELHRGYFVGAGGTGVPGQYVIEERSRCDSSFPVESASGATGYWQSCTRSRRGDFAYGDTHTGHDFGHFSCSDASGGSCELQAPPIVEGVDSNSDRIDDHGVCDQTGPLPDTPWRGMTHHSQFQCVLTKTTPDPSEGSHLGLDRLYDSGQSDPQPYEFSTCAANDCSGGAMGCSEATSQGFGQPDLTELSCTTAEGSTVTPDQVGWVSVRYKPEGTITLARPYMRGCIDESYGAGDANDGGWSDLCPGYFLQDDVNDDTCATAGNSTCEDGGPGSNTSTCALGTDRADCGVRTTDNSDAVLTAGNPGDSGMLICSCNRYYGGANCEVACQEIPYVGDESYLHVGDIDRGFSQEEIQAYQCSDGGDNYCSARPPDAASNFPGGRSGYWMCGDTQQSYDASLNSTSARPSLEVTSPTSGQTYDLRGGISATPVVRSELTGTGTVDNVTRTYTLY